MSDDALLTIDEAAELLAARSEFLAQLLDEGQIPSRLVGAGRMVLKSDVLTYKAKRDAERRKILDDLLRAEIEEGLIDLVPFDALVKK